MLRRIVALVVVLSACGDDGNNRHLADAPPVPDMEIVFDMPIDEPVIPPADLTLGITTSGNGTGRITSTPAGIDCGTTCSGGFEDGTMVTLTAQPDASSVFTGWGGACSGTSPICEVTLTADANVTATFALKTYTVTVTKAGAGTGTVMGNGINCGTGAGCSVTVDHGTAISLTATPANLNVFVGWGGACSGMGTCDLTITDDTAISAAFALDDLSLIVTTGGNGSGTITSAPAGISCASPNTGTCDFVFTANQMVTLTAAPAASSTFGGWSGACTGMGTCTVTMDAAKTVTGTFTLKTYVLGVTKTGSTGTGNVTSNPAGIACGTDCNETYDHGTMVTLTATATPGTSSFTGWNSGGCTGTAPCTVTLTAATTVNAVFAINSYPLTTSVTGMGSITSTPGGVACPGDCSENYNHGTVVSFSQMASPGYTFTGWGGDCSGTGACSVTMDMAHNVTATFTINSYDLNVSVTGMGTVMATNISCPSDCVGTYTHGTVVAVTQNAATGYTFTGWGGACSGLGLCNVTMDMMKSVTATFTLNTYALNVSFPGTNTGTGTVTATGISCPGDCSETFDHGTVVAVTQVPNGDSNFAGWGGACTGLGACNVTMDAIKTVTAAYTIKQYDLTASVTGSGTLTATGISCPGDCTGTYNHGTMVAVSQLADPGYQFTGWGGACSGLGACSVTMDMAKSVSATFTPLYTLTVARNGTGTGSVASMPAGTIACPGDCTETALAGTMITLVPTATMPGSAFIGWTGGGCMGTGNCTVTLDASKTVTATFDLTKHALTVSTSGLGKIDSSPAGISGCSSTGGTCMANFDYGTFITLTPSPGGSGTTANELVAWGGACAGTPVTANCTITITAATTATATFALAPNIIFTTSAQYSANLGGLSGANAICNQEAGALVGTGPKQNTRFIAFLSTPQVPFATQLSASGAPTGWRRPDGTAVFNRLGDLASDVVYYPPTWDATRDLTTPPTSESAPRVWTGSNPDGSFFGGCAGVGTVPIWWGGSGISGSGTYGLSSASSSMMVNTDVQNCATTTAHLLCLGVDRQSSVDVTPKSGRFAFTSTANFNFNAQGIVGADNICKAEATSAGLPGSYKALLATETASAISRFDTVTNRETWVRVGDKQPIVSAPGDFTNDALKNLRTAPNVNAAGTMRFGKTINWSGSTAPMQGGPGVSCVSWTANGKSKAGYAGDTSLSVWWDYAQFSGQTCNQEFHKVICLQE